MTRLLQIVFIGLFALGCGGITFAQTAPEPENKPAETKSEDQAPAKDSETVQDEFDIDAMFKRGEEQVKDGPTCKKPPDPIA